MMQKPEPPCAIASHAAADIAEDALTLVDYSAPRNANRV
jgi:hypothetical protein